jgi:hypothetical protein
MTVDEIRARVTVVRVWGVDHENFVEAHKAEEQLWEDVLRAIAAGAPDPATLATEALKSRLVTYPRGFD